MSDKKYSYNRKIGSITIRFNITEKTIRNINDSVITALKIINELINIYLDKNEGSNENLKHNLSVIHSLLQTLIVKDELGKDNEY